MHTFKKEERLSSKVAISQLFTTGKSFYSKPFKVLWLQTDVLGTVPTKILISVPKRSFKRAVDRNLLKRRIREAYRKNKTLLEASSLEKPVHLAFLYSSKTILPYSFIEVQMIATLKEATKRIKYSLEV